MEKLVPILNQLQSVLGILGSHSVALPQLVIVGSQSAGKSSVLENIVGKDFLPRGNNIVTRRPLVLQLLCLDGKQETTEWGEFDHLPNHRFLNFDDIKREIVNETERLIGKGTAISSSPIYLRIHSPNVPTLTLVDLPGITKVPTGDQPVDIEKQIRKMITHFISNPNSIIVAVSTATEDIVNSEAIKIAREVDPAGLRTLGVVTKLDLMDKGTDARDILQNKVIPLHLGFIGIVNRSQRDINERKPIHLALEAERQFFASSEYASMMPKIGTAYLTTRLTNLLLEHLQTFLPIIKQQINATVSETEKELQGYGNPLGIDSSSYDSMVQEARMNGEIGDNDSDILPKRLHGAVLLDIVSKFVFHYTNALEGRHTGAFSDVAVQQLYGGARIAFVFNCVFGEIIEKINPFDNLSDNEIRTAIRNATGPRPSLFLPEMSFELLVKKQIERLRQPVIDCVDMVMDELIRVAKQCQLGGLPQLDRFPALKTALMNCVKNMLLKRLQPTKNMVANLVNIELAYINTNHPDFIGGSRALTKLAKERSAKEEEERKLREAASATGDNSSKSTSNPSNTDKSKEKDKTSISKDKIPDITPTAYDSDSFNSHYGKVTSDALRQFNLRNPSEREVVETEVIKLLITSYFSIVKKTIRDTIPKAIMFMLVDKTKQEIQSELVSTLYKEDQFDFLLREAGDISEKRESCVKLLTIMKRALDIVSKINETNI